MNRNKGHGALANKNRPLSDHYEVWKRVCACNCFVFSRRPGYTRFTPKPEDDGMLLHRRDAMLRLGQVGLGALTLPGLLDAEKARATSASARRRPAKSCILLFLWGGPPQQDMWDMKPDTPQGIRSLFRPMQTVVPGIHLCDQMPLLARHT